MGTKYINGDLHVKGRVWQNEQEINVLFADANNGNSNSIIITSIGDEIPIIKILKDIAGWELKEASIFGHSLKVGIDLKTHSIDNLQLTDEQIAEFVKQATEQNLMTFELPSISQLKKITITKGNKSIIFNDMKEIDIRKSIPLLETVIDAISEKPLTISEIYDLYSGVDPFPKFAKVSYELLRDDGIPELHIEEPMILRMVYNLNTGGDQYYYIYAKPLDSEKYCFEASYNNNDHTLSEITAATIFSAENKKILTPDVDTELSLTSTNPVQNKVILAKLNDIDTAITNTKIEVKRYI